MNFSNVVWGDPDHEYQKDEETDIIGTCETNNTLTMTTETSHLAETVPTTIQIKIFSYLNVIDLIQNVNVLSKEYNHMVSNDSVLWRQLNVRQLTISTQRGYGMYPIVKSMLRRSFKQHVRNCKHLVMTMMKMMNHITNCKVG
eukprot:744496_1